MAEENPAKRRSLPGPRPLALHLGIQTMTWISSVAALESLNDGSLNWSPALAAAAKELENEIRACDGAVFRAAVEAQSRLRLAAFADGVNGYRAFRRRPRPPEPPAVWAEGSTRLLDYGAGSKGRPVVFAPSLINRGYILDLNRRRSLMRHLSRRGLRPFLVDWGAPEDQETGFGLDDYIAGRLERAVRAAVEECGRPVALAGYCMGGLLALALAAISPERISALVLMATPWDFHAMDSGKTRMLKAMIPAFEALLEVSPVLPVDVLQAMFTSLDAHLTPNKFRAFAGLDKRTARAGNFVALEDWLNDGVPLAGPTAIACLDGWYVKNKPGRGVWKISGRAIRPEDINIPSLVVVPMLDRIVPPATALPLAAELPASRCLKIKAGHIGMVAGSRAEDDLYSPLADWLKDIPG